jgi:2-polyprenyl-6-methoxyphenol hydroxylase-like FAD-dependent oxidoreductase
MANPVVLIVGAGPTGLVLAIYLARLGVKVRVIDKTAEAGTTSRALAVQARTLEFYQQLGFADRVVEGGVKIAGVNIWARGRRAARFPLGAIGVGISPYSFALVFPQDAHERLLIEELARLGVTVERRTALVGFEQDARGVRATIKRADGSEEVFEAAYLAGCDGASSTVREGLGIEFPGGTYAGRFYVADVEAAGPADDERQADKNVCPTNTSADDDELHVDLEEADFVLVFPLKGKGRMRLVGVVREMPEHVARELTFEDVGKRAIERLQLNVQKVNWFSTYRVHHRVAARFRERRAFLLGDAGHVHSPVGGQGMNTGIGDAMNLAWKLASVLKGEASERLLDTYEPERIRFARQLVATTDRAFTVVTARGFVARVLRTRVFPRVGALLFRLAWARRLAFLTVSQTRVNYRGAALSRGVAGRVRGGDRLPWVEMAGGGDNFAALRSMRWQVHVYGDAPAGLAEACAERGHEMHVFAWNEAARRAGLAAGAVYLVRPDGYVAWAGASVAEVRGWRV